MKGLCTTKRWGGHPIPPPHHIKLGIGKDKETGMKILIDTEWATFIEDLPTEKQLEFFWAVFDYSNRDCSLRCWKKIQPILEKGKIGYFNKIKKLKQFADTDTDTTPDTNTDTVAVRGSVSVNKNKNINNSREYTSSLSTTHVNTFTPPTEQEVLDYAADQNQFASAGGFACPPEIAQAFYDYYSSTGWTLSNDARTPILNWKPKLRQWATNPKYKPKEEPEEEWHL